MDQFNKEPNKSHDRESDSCGKSDLLKLFFVWLGASSDQSNRIFSELPAWFYQLVDVVQHVEIWVSKLLKYGLFFLKFVQIRVCAYARNGFL